MNVELGNRISIASQDEQVVVSVRGPELADLVEDHFAEHMDCEIGVRFPDDTSANKAYELFFPPNVDIEAVASILATLSHAERQQAESADDGL